MNDIPYDGTIFDEVVFAYIFFMIGFTVSLTVSDSAAISSAFPLTEHFLLYVDCPTAVTISPDVPSGGQVPAGTTFTCSSDGYTTPTYSWQLTGLGDGTGNGETFALPSKGGAFTLKCTATGNATDKNPCTAEKSFSATELGQSLCVSSFHLSTDILNMSSYTTLLQ